jgi:hypothetical protein
MSRIINKAKVQPMVVNTIISYIIGVRIHHTVFFVQVHFILVDHVMFVHLMSVSRKSQRNRRGSSPSDLSLGAVLHPHPRHYTLSEKDSCHRFMNNRRVDETIN